MTPEDRILCLCARQNFNERHLHELLTLCNLHKIQWIYVLETANQNGVSPLVYANLSKIKSELPKLPEDIFNWLKITYMRNVIVKKYTAENLEKILAFLSEKGIKTMLLKGAALDAVIYRQPWYTEMADVDLILRAKKEEIPHATLRQIVDFIEGFNHQPHQYNMHIEYDYYVHHDMTMNGLIAIDPERTWREAHLFRYRNQDVWILSPEDMLIASAVNSCRKRFFRLKTLCDLSSIIEKYPDLNWQAFINKAIAYRCNTIVYTALLVMEMTLGCSLPEKVFIDLHINPLRARLIRFLVVYLLQQGTLSKLSQNTQNKVFGHELSWGLVLTYATYRLDQITPKLGQVFHNWREPPVTVL